MLAGLKITDRQTSGLAAFEGAADDASPVKRVLDLLGTAVILTCAGGAIVYTNREASDLLKRGEPLRAEAGKLAGLSKDRTAALRGAIVKVATAGWSAADGLSIAVPFNDGRPAIAHVLALRDRPLKSQASDPVAVIFLNTARPAPAPTVALAELFHLTVAEQRVLASVLSGRNQTETAAHLGIAENTVKTHLSRIFSKTETHTQAELTDLARSLAVNVKA